MSSATPINREHAAKVSVCNFLIFFGCLAFHILGTWSVPLIDRDEPRFAEAAREMRERADYVIPYFNNRYRFDKPPLIYWFQVGSYRVFGENDFGARFPTALAAAGVSVLIFAWGSRLDSKRVGLAAAGIFATSLQVFLMAKAATADMWLVLFVTLAHWAGWELFQQESKRPPLNPPPQGYGATGVQRPTFNTVWWWIFSAALALGFLAKGPIAWAPVIAVASIALAVGRSRRSLLPILTAFVASVVLVCFWAVPALLRTNGEFFRIGIGRHVVERSFAVMEGHGASSFGVYLLLLPFYFVAVFASFFPWSIKLPALARKLWNNRKTAVGDRGYNQRDATDTYLLAGAGVIFLIFTFVRTKLPHYTLPAFPLLALLLARHLEIASSRFVRRVSIVVAGVLSTVALVAGPLWAGYFPARQLFLAARGDLRPEMEFATVGYNEPSLVWYFRREVRGFLTEPPLKRETAKAFMQKSGARFVILPTELAGSLFPNLPPDWKTFSTQGFNIAKGKAVDLTLLLKPDTP